jgi:hypothetical protein
MIIFKPLPHGGDYFNTMNLRIFVTLPLIMVLTVCDSRPNKISIPSDKTTVLLDNGLKSYTSQTKVLQATGGNMQKQTWIRVEVNPSEYKEILDNKEVMKGLLRSESSNLVASNHATDILSYDRKIFSSWIPEQFVFDIGFSGDRRSLAIFKPDMHSNSDRRILIFTTFR